MDLCYLVIQASRYSGWFWVATLEFSMTSDNCAIFTPVTLPYLVMATFANMFQREPCLIYALLLTYKRLEAALEHGHSEKSLCKINIVVSRCLVPLWGPAPVLKVWSVKNLTDCKYVYILFISLPSPHKTLCVNITTDTDIIKMQTISFLPVFLFQQAQPM